MSTWKDKVTFTVPAQPKGLFYTWEIYINALLNLQDQ